MTAGFELARFAWSDGAFEVDGRWHGDPAQSLGRARLVVELDGRRRRISGQGPRPRAEPGGAAWRGRFPCPRPTAAGPAELEVGGTLVIELPAPELPPEPPPDVSQAEELLGRLRGERDRLDRAAERLAQERLLAEAAATALAQARAAAEGRANEQAGDEARAIAERTAREVAAQAAREVAAQAAREAERSACDVARAAAERAANEAAERAVRNVAERVVREVAAAAAPTRPSEPPPAQAPPPPRAAAAATRGEDPTVALPPPAARLPAPTTPRREAIREALERPREPRGVLGESPMRRRGIALALVLIIGAIVAALILLLL